MITTIALRQASRLCASLFLCASLLSCVDDSYDMGKDIDMTVGLGSEGLQLKLGNTEPILLKDILEINDGENVNTTEAGLYYLIENGTTSFNFNIPEFSTRINKTELTPEMNIIDYSLVEDILGGSASGNLIVPDNMMLHVENVEAVSSMDLNVNNISKEIKSVKNVKLANGKINLKLEIKQSPGINFIISKIKNLKLHFPSYIEVEGAVNGVLNLNDCTLENHVANLGDINIKAINFEGEMGKNIVDGKLNINDVVKMEGDFGFKSQGSFSMKTNDYANITLSLTTHDNNGDRLTVNEVTGRFNPEISPRIDPISIGNDLPDFLKDEEVRVMVSNPTIKFDIDMSQVPVNIDMSGKLTASGNNVSTSPVYLPAGANRGETVPLLSNKFSKLYFYQGENPFDPNGAETTADTYRVDNISELIKVIPDHINVDMSGGKVSVKQNVLHTVVLDRVYEASVAYSVYVPFNFENGLKIVYTDVIDEMNDDLKDYEADGVTITANVENSVPLDLVAKITPIDVNGQKIPGIKVTDAVIKAAHDNKTEVTPIELSVTLANRSDLRKLDKIEFRIEASSNASGALNSEQYIHVKEIRLKLNGQVTADFN